MVVTAAHCLPKRLPEAHPLSRRNYRRMLGGRRCAEARYGPNAFLWIRLRTLPCSALSRGPCYESDRKAFLAALMGRNHGEPKTYDELTDAGSTLKSRRCWSPSARYGSSVSMDAGSRARRNCRPAAAGSSRLNGPAKGLLIRLLRPFSHNPSQGRNRQSGSSAQDGFQILFWR